MYLHNFQTDLGQLAPVSLDTYMHAYTYIHTYLNEVTYLNKDACFYRMIMRTLCPSLPLPMNILWLKELGRE